MLKVSSLKSSGHGEAVDFSSTQLFARYVTLTFPPVILPPVKVTITPMYNSYLDNNVARSCDDLYDVACFLAFALNYARNAVPHCIRLFARQGKRIMCYPIKIARIIRGRRNVPEVGIYISRPSTAFIEGIERLSDLLAMHEKVV